MDPDPKASARALPELLAEGAEGQLGVFLADLEPREAARAICELTAQQQSELLKRIEPEQAATLMDHLPGVTVVEAIEGLEADDAAAIVNALPSDNQADLVQTLGPADAEAILAQLDNEVAERITELASYPTDTAGGLMAIELVAFRDTATVAQTIQRLRIDSERLRHLDVQYAYVVERGRRLVGVLRLRDLLLADGDTRLSRIMIPDPIALPADAALSEVTGLFSDHAFLGVPVVDDHGILLGVVTRKAVDIAAQNQAASDYRRSMGVLVEELRSMPTLRRSRLRLAWLSINIVLNVIAASVIAAYQETLSQVIALAVFLPIISDMSGCSGNQAVAVSMRELNMGLLRPDEWLRVWFKEAGVGALNGLALGALLGVISGVFAQNAWLGLVVGVALALNTVLAVLLGGSLPLVLKRMKVDPALASSPILTTVTDMCGFFLVLSLAAAMIRRLTS